MGDVVRRKLFDGKMTAKQVHMALLAQACKGCAAPAVVTIRTFVPLGEVPPILLIGLAQQNGGDVPGAETKFGKYVRVSTVYVCERCAPTAEKVAAKHKSSWFVEIDRGPGDEKIQIANAS